jgi:hypothetical protein
LVVWAHCHAPPLTAALRPIHRPIHRRRLLPHDAPPLRHDVPPTLTLTTRFSLACTKSRSRRSTAIYSAKPMAASVTYRTNAKTAVVAATIWSSQPALRASVSKPMIPHRSAPHASVAEICVSARAAGLCICPQHDSPSMKPPAIVNTMIRRACRFSRRRCASYICVDSHHDAQQY